MAMQRRPKAASREKEEDVITLAAPQEAPTLLQKALQREAGWDKVRLERHVCVLLSRTLKGFMTHPPVFCPPLGNI